LLFVIPAIKSSAIKWLCRCVVGLITIGLIMTFSRGGILAFTIMAAGYIWHRRQFKAVFVTCALVVLGLVIAPDVVKERFSAGLRSGAVSDTANVHRDQLTAGRVYGWGLLAPEVLENPILGSGIGSTQWSAAVAAGRYRADHPHNIYLEILMDLGIVGLCAMFYLYLVYVRKLKFLSRCEDLSPALKAFFLGSLWSLFGIFAMAATTAYYMPNKAQSFMWFSFGLAFAYWNLDRRAKARLAGKNLASRDVGEISARRNVFGMPGNANVQRKN
jgi:O-antigen ligase